MMKSQIDFQYLLRFQRNSLRNFDYDSREYPLFSDATKIERNILWKISSRGLRNGRERATLFHMQPVKYFSINFGYDLFHDNNYHSFFFSLSTIYFMFGLIRVIKMYRTFQ